VKERLKKILPFVGYPIFYVVCLLVFIPVTFPYDKLKERIVATFNAQQQRGTAQQELQIDELDSWFVTGIKAKGIRLTSAQPDPTKPASKIEIDEARARVSLLGLLIGNKNISFKLTGFGGKVDGTFEDHGSYREVEVSLEGVDLGQIGPVRDAVGLPIEGKVNGLVKLNMPEGKASKGNGSITLEAKDVSIGDGKAKLVVGMLKDGLPLAKLTLGTLTFNAEAREGIIKITKFGAQGKDLDLVGEGRIQMRELATESNLDVSLRYKFAEAYKTKNKMTEGLFMAMDFDPKVKKSKRSDGYYAWQLKGPLGKPEPYPAGDGSIGGGGSMFGSPPKGGM
jgi:type II secretion system protein N